MGGYSTVSTEGEALELMHNCEGLSLAPQIDQIEPIGTKR